PAAVLTSASAQPEHPLLGERLRSPAIPGIVFQVRLTRKAPAFLSDHRILGSLPIPATAYLEMALATTPTAFGGGATVVEDVRIHEALVLPDEGARTVQIHLNREDSGTASFQIFALRDQDRWDVHASGRIRTQPNDPHQQPHSLLAQARATCLEEVPVTAFYADLRDRGIDFGVTFRGVQRLWRGDGQVLAHVALPELAQVGTEDYYAHPALLDAALQPLSALLPKTP